MILLDYIFQHTSVSSKNLVVVVDIRHAKRTGLSCRRSSINRGSIVSEMWDAYESFASDHAL